MSAFDPPPVPASLVRLATSLHQYAPGHIQNASKLSFSTSFKSAGMHHPQTAALLKQLDATRVDLATALTAGDSQTVVDTCTRYLPLIKRLLLSCEVQPDSAVLDERLNFKWQGGLDGDGTGGLIGKVRESQALMYEVSMTIGSIGVGSAGTGCGHSLKGDFPAACNDFKTAASVFSHMHSQHLPQWVALGSSTSEADLPAECVRAVAEGFEKMFLAHAQQMAVAKALQSSVEKMNMSILAKLTKGIQETMDSFVSQMRSNAGMHFCRLPGPYLSYITFQSALQEALSIYFQARKEWADGKQRGIAVSMMKTARAGLEVRSSITSKGIPEAINSSSSPLYVLRGELDDFKRHVDGCIAAWLRDINTVYFEKVPDVTPASAMLSKGLLMMKVEQWTGVSSDIVPVTLAVAEEKGAEPSAPPAAEAKGLERSDSDLARELQAKLNAGEDI